MHQMAARSEPAAARDWWVVDVTTELAAASDWWVVDVTKELAAANKKVKQWLGHSIYRVPASIKELSADTARAYQPQVVSLGPFHHDDEGLLPMEENKRRAMLRLLTRAGKTPEQLVAAVRDEAEELEGAYQDLGEKWRGGGEKREKFSRMMVLDGCFLLEIMRIANADGEVEDYGYHKDDPIFSQHGVAYTVPYVRRDMLVIENQLPLVVLLKLAKVLLEGGEDPVNNDYINKMVLRFMSPGKSAPPVAERDSNPLGLHPLDVFCNSLLCSDHKQNDRNIPKKTDESHGIIRSAVELYDAGIRFRKSSSDSLSDVRFRGGVLSLPHIVLDGSTEYMFLNVLAFERLHVGIRGYVTSYVFLMDNIIDSAKDVALLTSNGIIQNTFGSDKEAAKFFNGFSRDFVLDPDSHLYDLRDLTRKVNSYCKKPCNVWRANLLHTYFHSPWSFLSLAAAVFLLALTFTQTVYAVMQFYQGGNGNGSSSPPSPPAPR